MNIVKIRFIQRELTWEVCGGDIGETSLMNTLVKLVLPWDIDDISVFICQTILEYLWLKEKVSAVE